MLDSQKNNQPEVPGKSYKVLATLLLITIGWLLWQTLTYRSNTGEVLSRWSWVWFAGFVLPSVTVFAASLGAYGCVLARGRVKSLQRWRLTSPAWLVAIGLLSLGYSFAPGPPHRFFAVALFPLAYLSLRWAASAYRLSRSGLFRLVTVGLALAFSLVAAEIGLRVWAFAVPDPPSWALATGSLLTGKSGRYQPHHYQVYRLRPHYHRGGTHHNSLGFRGDEFALKKPGGVYRIVCIGGSTTYTEKVADDNQTYPALLEAKLRAKLDTSRVEVINAAVPGYTTAESLINMAFQISEWAPDLIIIYHAINDARPRFCNQLTSDYSTYTKTWDYENSLLCHSIVVRLMLTSLCARAQPRLYGVTRHSLPAEPAVRAQNLQNSDTRFFARNLTLIVAMARQLGAKVAFSTFAARDTVDLLRRQALKEANRTLRELGQTLNVPVLRFDELMPLEEEYFHDNVHVNDRGSERKAEIFADFVLEHFRSDISDATAAGHEEPTTR